MKRSLFGAMRLPKRHCCGHNSVKRGAVPGNAAMGEFDMVGERLRRLGRHGLFCLALLVAPAAALVLMPAAATAAPLPQYAPDNHLGVTSCAGSTCHGSAAPWRDSTVLQNEYITWQQKDRHAKAYATLHTDRSKRIARNLGLKNAHEAPVCLDCHADNPAPAQRGKVFQISDGVGCESCHGGAERWLGVHISGAASHDENIKAGMYPTEDPVARATLCLSCHFGTADKFVTHRIMGAGHPRMSFELDTFTAIQPAHFRVDDDYRKRKHVANGVQTWAIGQALAIAATLDGLLDPKRNRDGIFPELVFFDCHACHHPMSNIRWEPRAGTGLGPGVPRLNDANLVMLRVIAGHLDSAMGERLRRETLALHGAVGNGNEATVAAARTLRATVASLVDRFSQHNFGRADMQALLVGLVKEGMAGEYVDYAAAEQATMALSSVVSALHGSGAIDEPRHKAMLAALDKCYETVAKDEAYRPSEFLNALQAFQATLPKS